MATPPIPDSELLLAVQTYQRAIVEGASAILLVYETETATRCSPVPALTYVRIGLLIAANEAANDAEEE